MPNVSSLATWREGPTPGERFKLRPLSGNERASARRIRSDEAQLQALRILEIVDVSKFEASTSGGRTEADPTDVDLYDAATVLRAGVVEWEGADLGELTPASVLGLDDETYAWALREIIGMSVRPNPEALRSAPIS